MSDDVQATDKVLEPSRARTSPKTDQATILKCKADYEAGNWVSLKELGDRYGINQKTLQARITREGWAKQRAVMISKLEQRVEQNAVRAVDRVSDYLSNTFLRAKKYERMLDASAEQAGSKLLDGTPLLDPEMLDVLTRSEARIHELAKSALRIPVAAQLDITSKGQSVGESIVSAIAKLREAGTAIDITEEQAARILEMEIVDTPGS